MSSLGKFSFEISVVPDPRSLANFSIGKAFIFSYTQTRVSVVGRPLHEDMAMPKKSNSNSGALENLKRDSSF